MYINILWKHSLCKYSSGIYGIMVDIHVLHLPVISLKCHPIRNVLVSSAEVFFFQVLLVVREHIRCTITIVTTRLHHLSITPDQRSVVYCSCLSICSQTWNLTCNFLSIHKSVNTCYVYSLGQALSHDINADDLHPLTPDDPVGGMIFHNCILLVGILWCLV